MRCPTTTVYQTDGVLLARPHTLLDVTHSTLGRILRTVGILSGQSLVHGLVFLLRRLLLTTQLLSEVLQLTLRKPVWVLR